MTWPSLLTIADRLWRALHLVLRVPQASQALNFFAIDSFLNNARLVICYTLLAPLLSITMGVTANICMYDSPG